MRAEVLGNILKIDCESKRYIVGKAADAGKVHVYRARAECDSGMTDGGELPGKRTENKREREAWKEEIRGACCRKRKRIFAGVREEERGGEGGRKGRLRM